MKKTIAIILFIAVLGGIFFSFFYGIDEKIACSCMAGSKFGIGIITMITNNQVTNYSICPNTELASCYQAYTIIPIDFIIISLILLVISIFLFRIKPTSK
ncbi:hypothetical protein KKF61_03450 [Patescibacteria group bacterium]|nr:hypothetical protein [Patescibacteria group bacterium]MBU0963913.1 hypothetical protein [Patescibacteria group bacterium]